MADHNDSIAIVGAGIAGLVLAIGLHKQNLRFTLYEAASQHSVVGAGIGLGPNGLLAMDLIERGFRRQYEAVCVGNKSPKDENVFFEGLLCEEGLELVRKLIMGAPNYIRKFAHRKELLDILTSHILASAVRFNKSLQRIDQHDDGVLLHFEDGEAVKASALVGSDGIESIVREHVLKSLYPDQVKPLYADSYCYRAVIPMEEAREILGTLTDTAKIYVGKDRMVVTYRVSGGREFNFLHCVSRPGEPWTLPNAMTEKVTHQQMLADFQDHAIDERLIRLLDKAKPVRWGLFHHLHTSTYYRGRAALIGHSAHASLPFQAAGAGMGLEDALILSTVLGRIDPKDEERSISMQLEAAFEAYDFIRRPRAQRQTEQSADATSLLYCQDAQAGSDMNSILARMQGGRFDWLWFRDLKVDVEQAGSRMDRILAR